jgi:hypothetical protein
MSSSAIPTLPEIGPWTLRILGLIAALLLVLLAVVCG